MYAIRSYYAFFLRRMSEKLVRTAYKELRQIRVSTRTEGSLYLFSAQVGAIVKGEPQVIHAEDTVQNAAIRMAQLHIGSLLVQDGNGDIIGIITVITSYSIHYTKLYETPRWDHTTR